MCPLIYYCMYLQKMYKSFPFTKKHSVKFCQTQHICGRNKEWEEVGGERVVVWDTSRGCYLQQLEVWKVAVLPMVQEDKVKCAYPKHVGHLRNQVTRRSLHQKYLMTHTHTTHTQTHNTITMVMISGKKLLETMLTTTSQLWGMWNGLKNFRNVIILMGEDKWI